MMRFMMNAFMLESLVMRKWPAVSLYYSYWLWSVVRRLVFRLVLQSISAAPAIMTITMTMESE